MSNSVFAGFGVSPGVLEEEKLVPGSSFERTIYLVQGTPDKEITIEASIESEEIKDWISFKEGDRFVIPAGVQQFPLTVSVTVPNDAELGEYSAFIRVNTVPEKSEDSQITIALGGRIDVRLTVGDDVISEFSVKSMKLFDIKENKKPKAAIVITNTGNVSTAPDSVTFELFNKYGDVRLAFAENKDFEKVRAFSEKEIILEFPIDIKLAPGEYWGHAKVYNDGVVIKELRTVFNVTEISLVEKLLIPGITLIIILAFALVFRSRIASVVRRR